MNIIDVVIVLILILGAILGFKRGAIKSFVSFAGVVLSLVIAYFLKNPIASLMYEYLPFFNFGGVFKGVTVLNILFYEVLAYFLVLFVLFFLVRFLDFFANIIEKGLKLTIILGIPSKIIGIFIGFIETYIYIFTSLYFLSLPMFNIRIVNESTLTNRMLNNTPVLSSTIEKPLNAIMDVYNLSKKYDQSSNEEFNKEALEVLLKNNIVEVESIDKLVEKKKINIDNINIILDKYR